MSLSPCGHTTKITYAKRYLNYILQKTLLHTVHRRKPTYTRGNRLEFAPIFYDAKLPKHHLVVELLTRHIHYSNAHIGQESSLRQMVWICQARSLVRRVNKCFVCRKINAPPCRVTPYEPHFVELTCLVHF